MPAEQTYFFKIMRSLGLRTAFNSIYEITNNVSQFKLPSFLSDNVRVRRNLINLEFRGLFRRNLNISDLTLFPNLNKSKIILNKTGSGLF